MRKVRNGSHLQLILLVISTFLLAILVILPVFTLLVRAFTRQDGSIAGFDNFVEYFTTPNLTASLLNSLYISSMTTVIAVILAFLYSYALTRTKVKGRSFFRFTSMLPLFAPTMMLGIGLTYLFGNKGIITMAGFDISLYGPVGIIISEVIYVFPQVVLVLSVSFSYADNRLYEAAEVMGTSALRKFITITLPGIKYGLISSLFIAFTLSFTDFGAPKAVGGNFNVLATDIYKQVVGQQNFTMGAVVGIILMIPAVIAFAVDRMTQNEYQGTINAKSVDFKTRNNRKRDIFCLIYCSAINLGIFMVLGAVVFASLIKLWPYDLSLTFEHYLKDSPSTGGISSYINSIIVGLLTAIVGTAFIFINAYLIEKTRKAKPIRQSAYFLSLTPLAFPGLAIGISFIFFFNMEGNPLNFIYGTMWILIFANLVHFYSVPFVTATSSLKKLDKEFEVVAESMGVPFVITFFKVTLPMCLPAILEIFVYLFVNSMVTVSAVVFLYPAEFKLAAVAIVNMEDAGNIAQAAALSVLIILTNIVVRLVYELINKRLKRGGKNKHEQIN